MKCEYCGKDKNRHGKEFSAQGLDDHQRDTHWGSWMKKHNKLDESGAIKEDKINERIN